MWLNKFILFCFIFILAMSFPALADDNRPLLGIDYGSAIIQLDPLSLLIISGDGDGPSINSIVPKNIRARFEYPFSKYVHLRITTGYGTTSSKYERNTQFDSFSSRTEFKLSTSGFPLEGGIHFQAWKCKDSIILIRGGIVLGYYSYNNKVEGFDQFNGQRDEFTEPDVKISGVAQSFVVGCGIAVSENVTVIFELAKIGWSMIKIKQDIEIENTDGSREKIGEWKQDWNALTGTNDLSVVLGISFALGSKKSQN